VIETLAQDLRYAARALRKNIGFTAVASLTLALGVGANVAVFSLVDGVLLQSLPYAAPDRLVSITGTYPNGAFAAMRAEVRTLDVAAYADGQSFNLVGLGEAVRLPGTRVSAELFTVLGVQPLLGRTFRPGEDTAGQDRFVILSHALWQQRFGSDPGVIGRSIELQGMRREIVGVMPDQFRFPSTRTQLWIPLSHDARDVTNSWAGDYMPLLGRLRPGATMDRAHTEVRLFQSRVRALFPWRMPADWNANITVIPLQRGLVSDARTRLLILLGAVALVLLIACANVANLTLARAAVRDREVAIRAALGAAPRRIARQLLTESVLLALIGSVLGLLLASYGVPLLKQILPPDTPRLAEVHVNWRLFAFTGALAVVTGCLFGLAPVIQARRSRLSGMLDAGSRGNSGAVSNRLRTTLTVAQIALAVLLVNAAGLLIRSLWTLSHVDPGFRSDHVVTARISPNVSVCGDPERCLAFYRELEERAAAASGTSGAALASTLPLAGTVTKRSLELAGLPATSQRAPLFWLNVITPDYFRVMGIPMQAGRSFTRADLAGPRVAILAAGAARRFWPNESPIGKQLRFVNEREWRTVVGVAADVRALDLTKDVPGFITGIVYVPYTAAATQEDGRIPTEMTLVVRTASDTQAAGAELRRLVASASREVAVGDVKAMDSYVSDSVATPVSTTWLFVTFGALALALGSVGVYGVLSFLVSSRTREIGIRLAIGAQTRDVSWMIMKQGARVCLLGLVCGNAAAFALARSLSSELYGISPTDPSTYAAVALVVIVTTVSACYVPMRRATRIDPMIALRA
jgi:predicted permease